LLIESESGDCELINIKDGQVRGKYTLQFKLGREQRRPAVSLLRHDRPILHSRPSREKFDRCSRANAYGQSCPMSGRYGGAAPTDGCWSLAGVLIDEIGCTFPTLKGLFERPVRSDQIGDRYSRYVS